MSSIRSKLWDFRAKTVDVMLHCGHNYTAAHCNKQPTPLPPQLLNLPIIMKPDWTSKLWTDLWMAISYSETSCHLQASLAVCHPDKCVYYIKPDYCKLWLAQTQKLFEYSIGRLWNSNIRALDSLVTFTKACRRLLHSFWTYVYMALLFLLVCFCLLLLCCLFIL